MKTKLKLWYVLIILAIVVILARGDFLGSILPGQVKDFNFAHFAYAQDRDDKYLWTSSTFNIGDTLLTTEKVGSDHCTNFVYEGKSYHVCEGEEVMLNPYLKVKFSPVFKNNQGGWDSYIK